MEHGGGLSYNPLHQKCRGTGMKFALLVGAAAIAQASVAAAKYDNSGTYLCTVSEKAGITSQHREGAGPPSAIKYDDSVTRFKMQISPINLEQFQFRLIELPYDGGDRDKAEWHTEHSVLHGEYRGDGNSFVASKDQAFFAFGKTDHKNSDGNFEFYHAGFEYPGGEDTKLSARWGRCKKL